MTNGKFTPVKHTVMMHPAGYYANLGKIFEVIEGLGRQRNASAFRSGVSVPVFLRIDTGPMKLMDLFPSKSL